MVKTRFRPSLGAAIQCVFILQRVQHQGTNSAAVLSTFLNVRVLRADRVRADVDAEDSLLRGPFSAEDPTLDLCNGKFDAWTDVVAELAGSTGATHDRLFALAVEQNIDRA